MVFIIVEEALWSLQASLFPYYAILPTFEPTWANDRFII